MTSHKINIGKAVYSLKQREDGSFNAYNCNTLREVKSENTIRKIFKALVERDHAEALEEYDARNTLYVYAPGDDAREVWDQMTPIEQTVSVEMRHAEALEMNRLFNMRAASDDRPQRLAKETGFPVLTCLKELIAEEGDYFAALERLRQIVSDAHAEALKMNADTDRRRHLSVMASIQNTIMERDDLPALVEACHAAAHEMNDEYDIAKVNAARVQSQHGNASQERQERWLAEAHAEALEINAAIDSMIQARQQIANKEPDFLQETWDLVRLGNSYKEAGREWYRWAKATALRLWESSLAQRQIFQA